MPELDIAAAQSAERFYFDSLAKGQFLLPLCEECDQYHFYPRVVCPHCGENRLRWQAPSGKGSVYSTTTVRRSDGDYTVSLIDLEEGPRMMSRVVDMAPDDVTIGMAVIARIDQVDGQPLVVFVPDRSKQI